LGQPEAVAPDGLDVVMGRIQLGQALAQAAGQRTNSIVGYT